MSTQIPNLEEAANVAAEFIYSIDNLPHEVSHILQEIKHRETRTQELQQEIDKDSNRYIRSARRASSVSAGTPPSPSSSRAPSPKLLSIPAKITASYAEIQELAQEKCHLATRLIEIITRARAKLDIDIVKVRTLQGDSPEVIAAAAAAAANAKPLAMLGITADGFGAPGRNPALAISESLRNALSMPAAPEPKAAAGHTALSPSPAPPPTKKRRIASSIKISPASTPTKHRSASPSAPPASAHVQTKSRLSRQVQIPVEEESPEPELEGEGEASDYVEMDEEVDDERLYCFCQKQSYGDMIACDNRKCQFEWFHLGCVGLKQPTPKIWFCSQCAGKKATQGSSSTKKGRKK